MDLIQHEVVASLVECGPIEPLPQGFLVAFSRWFAWHSSESTRCFERDFSCMSAIQWSNSLGGARQLSCT